ncbi:MAG: ABC transporter permease subunit [Rhodanobacter sp.]|nr:MAG: ABC transporter permease subunit [Rhodanobacter sp.]
MTRWRTPDPWLTLLLLLTVGPMVVAWIFMVAYASGGIGLLSTGWTLAHWRAALASGETWASIGYSFALAAVTMIVALGLAMIGQAVLGAHARRGALGSLLFVPLAVPPLVAALLSIELFGNTGWLARLSHAAGLIDRPDQFPALLFTRSGSGIVLTQVCLVAPFLWLLVDRLMRHARVADLGQVARTLGASSWQVWRRVTFPVVLRAGAPTFSVYFIVLAGAFEVPLMVGAQYPQVVSLLIQRKFDRFDLTSKPEAYAIAALYAVIAVTALLALFRWHRHRVGGEGDA